MRAHNVIVVTSGQADAVAPGQLDRTIQAILDMKKNPIVVLGPDGDALLRDAQLVDQCDVVFDPNFEGGFFSSAHAGLHATHGAAFVIPLKDPLAPLPVWQQLESELMKESAQKNDVLKALTPEAENPSPSSVAGPLLVTQRGVQTLKKLAARTDWEKSERVARLNVPTHLP
jgi:hypothetical protein